MPLHGWLLEPWRREAHRLEKDTGGGAEGQDLRELWADVFERAVLGWSQAAVEGKGVVEKALAYHEQTSGWVETRSRWYDLVNTAVCRHNKCRSLKCKAAHPFVFIVAIDDVDLQVEHVPHLLHAIRLLHHPNVVYVLTGNMEHLRFVLELDYIGQHGVRPLDLERSAEQDLSKAQSVSKAQSLSGRIKSYSCTLRDALLEKALPSHATLTLPLLSLEEVLSMHVDTGGDAETVEALFDKLWPKTTKEQAWPEIAKLTQGLRVVTARHAQHAIDKHLSDLTTAKKAKTFAAELFGTELDKQDRIALRGRLTTLLGPVFQTWEGDQLSIELREQPLFAFASQFGEADYNLKEGANRAAVLQCVVDKKLVEAPGLDWQPEAGVATTSVQWKSDISGIAGNALFHWPWLNRPTVGEILEMGDLANAMKDGAGGAKDRENLHKEILLVWLRKNIRWQRQREGHTDAKIISKTMKIIANELKLLCNHKTPLTKNDARRWVRELMVMTAPYFGLSDTIASALRKEFKSLATDPKDPENRKNRKELGKEEIRMVRNAIIVWRRTDALQRGQALDIIDDPTSPEVDDAVDDFLKKREEMSPNDLWWKFRLTMPAKEVKT